MTLTTAGPFLDFPATFAGQVLRPGDEGFDDAREIWNVRGMRAEPALIARASDEDDVVLAVAYANANDMPLAVRSGGHGVDGSAMPAGALVVDLSSLKGVRLDPETGRATVAAGVLLGEMDAATQAHGYVVPAGVVTRTGAAGLTLGGGIGHLTRRFGATVDNLISVDVVTMDGRRRTVSAEEEPELFWGLKGAGHNLAIATSFTFQAKQVGPQVVSGNLIYSAEAGVAVIDGLDAALAVAPRELSVTVNILPAPPIPGLPADAVGKPVVLILVVYTGDLAGFDGAMADIRALGIPMLDPTRPSSWLEANSIVDAYAPVGRCQYLEGGYLPVLTADIARLCIQALASAPRPTRPGPASLITIPLLGGAIFDCDEDSAAFSRTDANWLFEVATQWDGEALDDAHLTWVKTTMAALESSATRNAYINLSAHRGQDWLRRAYGSTEKWRRLVALKQTWDPHNRLAYNKNIVEAASAQ